MSFLQTITIGAAASGIEAVTVYENTIGWLATSIGLLAALSLLPTMERVAASRTVQARNPWILAGAASMAIGTCAMLYTGMFGMNLPIPARLDATRVVLAPLPGILFFIGMIWLVGVRHVVWWRLHLAALLCSIGLSGMHYAVLLSLGLKATIVVEPGGITVPLIIGYAGTMVGLYAYFGLAGIQTNSLVRRLLGACCLTFSTIGNHFSAMGQTRFFTEQNLGDYVAVMHPDTLPVIVILVSVIVGMLWIGSMVDARLSGAILAMEESEERCRAIINGMLDAHITADSSGLIQTMNPAAEKLFGYTLAEARGKPVTLLVAPEHHAANSPEAMRAAIGQPGGMMARKQQYENAGRHRDGRTFPVEVVTSGLTISRGMYFSAIVRDLTIQRTAEAELRLLGAAVENASEAVCITSLKGSIEYVNQAWEKRLSLPRTAMFGKTILSLQKYIVEYNEQARIRDAFLQNDSTWAGPVISELPDGRRLHEEVLVTPLRKPDGRVSHYVTT
ncbi:MAG: PAS domain S-box protein, partial [Gammaproteobacteria bacterium]